MAKLNVIIILLDGLRADRVYLCPNLQHIAKSGYFFSNMITSAPYTLASLHSIITSLYPSKNGVNSYFNMFKFKKDVCKTLAQYLHDKGYYTEANLVVDSLLPSQGFDAISTHDEYNDNLTELHKNKITALSDKPFFLFLHYTSLHTQSIINVGKKYTDFDQKFFNNYEANKKMYNSCLDRLDLYVKEIFEHAKNLGLLNKTILIFMSDHGTSNGEKIGEKMYGSFTYDYTIKVFCLITAPNIGGKEISFQTRTIDIMPTIIDILGIEADESYEHIQGKSLIPLIQGEEKEDRVAFSETGGLYGPWPSHNEHNVFCIRLRKWKLIYNKTPDTWEMYDLQNDPKESNNIFNKNNDFALKLQGMLLSHIKSNDETMVF